MVINNSNLASTIDEKLAFESSKQLLSNPTIIPPTLPTTTFRTSCDGSKFFYEGEITGLNFPNTDKLRGTWGFTSHQYAPRNIKDILLTIEIFVLKGDNYLLITTSLPADFLYTNDDYNACNDNTPNYTKGLFDCLPKRPYNPEILKTKAKDLIEIFK